MEAMDDSSHEVSGDISDAPTESKEEAGTHSDTKPPDPEAQKRENMQRESDQWTSRSELLRQLPPDDPMRKVLTEFYSRSGEALANFDAKFAGEALAGRPHDPQQAMRLAVSQYSRGCKAALSAVRDIESAAAVEQAFKAVIDGFLTWFVQWVKLTVPDEADRVTRELLPELNRRLLKALHNARAGAWKSIRALAEAPVGSVEAGARAPEVPPGQTNQPGPGGAKRPSDAHAVSANLPRKRGRPQTISDDLKSEALSVRANRANRADKGTLRVAAQVLYQREYPTPQQVKSASTILRIFRRKLQQSNQGGEPFLDPQ
ncbi:MAG: hypothetical protein ABI759_03210 [Candidatus Solibacter sp.]